MYSQQLSSDKPGYIVLLIDQSGSMSDTFGGKSGDTKAEECAKAVNRVLREIGLACASGEIVKNRVNVSVISYGSQGNQAAVAFYGPLSNKQIVSVQELTEGCLRIESIKRKVPDGAGGLVEVDDQFPVWVEPVASGTTPMDAALSMAASLVKSWTQANPDSFPPIVVNITDGAPDNEALARQAAQALTKIGTNDGETLLLNAHISSGRGARVELPASEAELPPGDSCSKFLFDISSRLPGVMLERAGAVGYRPTAGARGFVYNADAETMIRLLDIGTRAKLE
jgi:hypothetical protein